MIEHDHRHLFEAEPLRREQAPVPGYDDIVFTDKDRIDEDELSDRAGDLCDLISAMRPGVADIGDELIDRDFGDLQRRGSKTERRPEREAPDQFQMTTETGGRELKVRPAFRQQVRTCAPNRAPPGLIPYPRQPSPEPPPP